MRSGFCADPPEFTQAYPKAVAQRHKNRYNPRAFWLGNERLLVVRRLFIAQFVLVIVLACVWGFFDQKIIPSILYGGAACILPNFYFAYRFFSRRHVRQPKQILVSFYLGELMKMIVSALIIVLAILYAHAWILPTVIAYFVANLAFWFAPTILLRQQARWAE